MILYRHKVSARHLNKKLHLSTSYICVPYARLQARREIVMKKYNFVYEADHVHNTIYVDVDSMKRAGQIDAPEYKRFLEIKAELPGYAIQTKVFDKKEKCTYKS